MYFWSKGDQHHLKFKERKLLGKEKEELQGVREFCGNLIFFLLVIEISAVVEGAKLSSTNDSPGRVRGKEEGDLLGSAGHRPFPSKISSMYLGGRYGNPADRGDR